MHATTAGIVVWFALAGGDLDTLNDDVAVGPVVEVKAEVKPTRFWAYLDLMDWPYEPSEPEAEKEARKQLLQARGKLLSTTGEDRYETAQSVFELEKAHPQLAYECRRVIFEMLSMSEDDELRNHKIGELCLSGKPEALSPEEEEKFWRRRRDLHLGVRHEFVFKFDTWAIEAAFEALVWKWDINAGKQGAPEDGEAMIRFIHSRMSRQDSRATEIIGFSDYNEKDLFKLCRQLCSRHREPRLVSLYVLDGLLDHGVDFSKNKEFCILLNCLQVCREKSSDRQVQELAQAVTKRLVP